MCICQYREEDCTKSCPPNLSNMRVFKWFCTRTMVSARFNFSLFFFSSCSLYPFCLYLVMRFRATLNNAVGLCSKCAVYEQCLMMNLVRRNRTIPREAGSCLHHFIQHRCHTAYSQRSGGWHSSMDVSMLLVVPDARI